MGVLPATASAAPPVSPLADSGGPPRSAARTGVAYGLAAYGFWGLAPVYFKLVQVVPAVEVLAHRVIWSVVVLVLLTLARRRWRAVLDVVRRPATLRTLCLTSVLIGGNWLVFIWAVGHGHVMQASLGYFIGPLVSVLLGFVFLRERLTRGQSLSVLLAAAGVVYLTVSRGQLPVLGLFLAFSFALYGLLRKTAAADALTGLTVETMLLMPLAVAFLGHEIAVGRAVFASGDGMLNLLLLAAGPVTTVPLLWFAAAARRLRLATVGFLQYVTPTGHFLLALAYGESFTSAHGAAFACIWIALAIYSADTGLRARQAAAAVRGARK